MIKPELNTQHKILSIATLLALQISLFHQVPAYSQTIDSCMQAKGNNAVELCSMILEAGTEDPNVYYKLASELYQRGDVEKSLELINSSLTKYPNNDNLTRLKSYVELDNVEAQQLKQSAEKNASRIELGKMKIACRTQNTQAGLDACNDYLSRTGVDKDLIESRIAELESQLKPTTRPKPIPSTVVAANEPAPQENSRIEQAEASKPLAEPIVVKPKPVEIEQPVPKQVDLSDLDNTVAATTPDRTADDADASLVAIPSRPANPAIADAEKALKELILNVQTNLQALGFDTGEPDGIPGRRTRLALDEFYQTNPVPDNEFSQNGFISESTLADLQLAMRTKSQADRLLFESQTASSNGDYLNALARLDEATRTSPLLLIPVGYREKLESAVLAERTIENAPSTDQESTLVAQSKTESEPQPGANVTVITPSAQSQPETNLTVISPSTQSRPEPISASIKTGIATGTAPNIKGIMDKLKVLESQLLSFENSLNESERAISRSASTITF